MKKIVAFGGGTGLSALLRGIRSSDFDITAVVTMTDNGSSTGVLRRELNVLPPGDVRQCIAALSADESAMVDLFQYRFQKGDGLAGHSLGNLIISALEDMTGNFETAIETISLLLGVKGAVLPSSLENVHLVATFDDGTEITGETEMTKYGYEHKIDKIRLTKEIKANPKVIKAINSADYILIGPGGLYHSIIPNFLFPEVVEEVARSKAPKLYICNVSTERGETAGFCAEDHRDVLIKYGIKPDLMLVNNRPFPEGSGDGYVFPVTYDEKDETIITADLVNEQNFLYHDSAKLGKEISAIIEKPLVTN